MLWNGELNQNQTIFIDFYNDEHDKIHCDVTLYTVKQRSSKYYELKLFMLLLILLKAFVDLAFSYGVDVLQTPYHKIIQ